MTEECRICYYQFPPEDFFELKCCRDKRICTLCLNCLRIPLCPYCRSIIPEIQDRCRLSQSFAPVSHYLLQMQADFLTTEGIEVDPQLDLRLLDSRILRRRIRRLRRRNEHTRNQEENRARSEWIRK